MKGGMYPVETVREKSIFVLYFNRGEYGLSRGLGYDHERKFTKLVPVAWPISLGIAKVLDTIRHTS